jgi:hypothetical protein
MTSASGPPQEQRPGAATAENLVGAPAGTGALVCVSDPLQPAARVSGSPEARAVAFLGREIVSWPRSHGCFSCHNNADAARALVRAEQAGFALPAETIRPTADWLGHPERWDLKNGEAPFHDPKLARVAFSAALAALLQSRRDLDRAALRVAADRLQADQNADGAWPIEGEEGIGAPATYGTPLATLLARQTLAEAGADRFKAAIEKADRWLLDREPEGVSDAAVQLWALSVVARPATPEADTHRTHCQEAIRLGQSDDGGWGRFRASPSEPFDTAIVLLALTANQNHLGADRDRIKTGRAYLIAQQQDDGGWPETTRPPGGTSYAERISTSAWATLALIASRPAALNADSATRVDADADPSRRGSDAKR